MRLFVLLFITSSAFAQNLVEIRTVDPTIAVEARYATSHNFIGRPIAGYRAEKCFLTPEAATALGKVQSELRTFGMSLKAYDCYRPQRAVNDFIEWAKDASDQKMKQEFYPHVDKADVFKLGYVAEKSGHSRGSTIDLTIIGLDFGTTYDYFDELAHTANPNVPAEAKRNRLLLKSVMEKFGFKNYENEWWHFTLANEPYPQTYFDVEIK
ncbi:MAG TPA: M15 family metallopeptidase [Thermoanaerobaculia bacterium]|nr:M15 family metallopeptidase [Thermoanaerobaculia bacterium]